MATGTGKKIIGGYTLEQDFNNLSGNARWAFAQKDGKSWFIKEFYEPKWPMNPELLDASAVDKMKGRCKKFFSEKQELYNAINSCSNGNLITIEAFFREGSCYYAVMERVPAMDLDMPALSREPEGTRLLVLKVLTDCMCRLHERGVVYADLRPDNVLLKRTASGKVTAKLIDFDGSFLEWHQPASGALPVSEEFISPEVADLFFEVNSMKHEFTKKIDVFSLGLLFHICWTGELPRVDEPFVCAAVLEGSPVRLDPRIPAYLRETIAQMLRKNPYERPDLKSVLKALQEQRAPGTEKTPSPVKPPVDTPVSGIKGSLWSSKASPRPEAPPSRDTGTAAARTPSGGTAAAPAASLWGEPGDL